MVGAKRAVTLAVVYQVPVLVAPNSTVGLVSLVELKFQASDKLVAAVSALVMPAEVPSIWRAAAREAASTYVWVSLFTMKMCPKSIARPIAATSAIAEAVITTRTNPRWRNLRFDFCWGVMAQLLLTYMK